MQAQPQQEHRWLQQLVGEWTFEGEAIGPDQQAMRQTGTERVRSLGDLWIVAEGEGDMPGGGPATWMMTLGYDPQQERYLGTWVGSMMTHLWVYEGQLDETGKTLPLEAEGPGMTPGSTARYRDVIELVSDDHRTLTSYVLGDDGQWHRFMTVDYRRVR